MKTIYTFIVTYTLIFGSIVAVLTLNTCTTVPTKNKPIKVKRMIFPDVTETPRLVEWPIDDIAPLENIVAMEVNQQAKQFSK
jgi:hypothetical protein